MRLASLPVSISRFSVLPRRALQYLGLAVFLIILLSSLSSNRREQVTELLPPKLRPQPTKALRPGQYVDKSRQRKVPDTGDEPPLIEADGVGTLHDQRDGRFYQAGTLFLTSDESPPKQTVYDPYPDYNGEEWKKIWKGNFAPCQGPRGSVLDRSKQEDMVAVYRGSQQDFPFPMFGSHEALELDANVCADRCARWSAYGYMEEDGHSACPKSVHVNWDKVNWGKLQSQCIKQNANRYSDYVHTVHETLLKPNQWTTPGPVPKAGPPAGSQQLEYHSRTAIIVRSWSTMDWTASHRQYLRSLIMELALHSGGEYELFLLDDVKVPIDLHDERAVKRLKKDSVPAEFHDITVLFNEEVLEHWYPKIEEHTAVYQHLQPIQIFSQLHPDFDFYWQFEMDARNTGHTYHFLEQAASFAKRQPRKYLWERNAYFYAPGAHGTWDDFVHIVDRTMKGREETSVWGPVPAPGASIKPAGPTPPIANPRHENYLWGVDEEADLITLLPIFDAKETHWTFPNITWNAPFDLPRRASPITMWRMSRQLLTVMHDAANEGMAVVSEMSAPTFALLHGLKAVAAPHPIYVDGQWTTRELAPIVNRGSDPAKINGGNDSLWNWDHKWDHILFRMSYMFTTQTAEDLIRRWLGYEADPNQYTDGSLHRDPQGRFWYDEGRLEEDRFGRLCFPIMLVHTVKNTEKAKGKDMAVPV